MSETPSITSPFALRSIYLQASKVELANGFDPTIPNQPLLGQFRAKPLGEGRSQTLSDQEDKALNTYDFFMRMEFRYIRPKSDGQAPNEEESLGEFLAAQIIADFVISYTLTSSDLPSREDLTKWANTNALAHIWPYWREYCQSTMCRMSLPVTSMPLLDINFKSVEKPKKSRSKAMKGSVANP